MRVEYINPFIKSVGNTFQTMLSCEVERGELTLRTADTELHEYSGIIGLSGKAVGSVVLSLSKPVASKSTAALLMMSEAEISDDDIVDAVGELANMVAGAAKAELQEYEMSVSLPSVITGSHHQVHFPSDVHPICVHFNCDWGPLKLEVGLSEVPTPAEA